MELESARAMSENNAEVAVPIEAGQRKDLGRGKKKGGKDRKKERKIERKKERKKKERKK